MPTTFKGDLLTLEEPFSRPNWAQYLQNFAGFWGSAPDPAYFLWTSEEKSQETFALQFLWTSGALNDQNKSCLTFSSKAPREVAGAVEGPVLNRVLTVLESFIPTCSGADLGGGAERQLPPSSPKGGIAPPCFLKIFNIFLQFSPILRQK